jgi:hypothetical protein
MIRKKSVGRDVVFYFVLIIMFVGLLSGCIIQEYSIRSVPTSQIPIEYVNMSSDQLADYPHLLESFQSNVSIKTPKNEFDQVRGFLQAYNTSFVRYDDTFYEVTFIFAD